MCTQRPEELESQRVVSHRMCVLGTELGFSERAAHALTLCVISPATLLVLFSLIFSYQDRVLLWYFQTSVSLCLFAHNSLLMSKLSLVILV